MDEKYILKKLKPLKTKIFIHKAIEIIFWALIISGCVSLILAFASKFAVITFVRYKMLVLFGVAIFTALIVSLFFIPSKKQLIMTADSLGVNERIITAWYLFGDESNVAQLQRQDTKNVLGSIDLASEYKINHQKSMHVFAFAIIAFAFILTFIPGRVFDETQIREKLVQQMDEQEKQIEEQIENQQVKDSNISQEQLEQLKEALEKLSEEFNKSKTEEDALKALTQMENLLEDLKRQDPLKELDTLQSAFSDSLLTKDIAQSMESEDEEALKQALEDLKEQLEHEEKRKELSEILQAAAMNMSENSALSQALQDIASLSASGSMSSADAAQSLIALINDAEKNAQGQEDFKNALSDISGTLSKAKRSISAVDQRVASGDSAQKGQSSGEGDSQTGSDGQSGQGGNQSGTGSSSQGAGAGSGDAGDGTTNTDWGYNEGDEPGKGKMPGARQEADYKRIYVPERLGGEGNEMVLPGEKLDSGSSTYSNADGAPVMEGAMVPYQEVLSEYRQEAVQRMDGQNIPAGMKELVKSYFSSLD
ncbi:MAG TPA: hypothetical protein VFD00_03525 [Thermoclostridium sp.]|nr:hypothetical protein [Thermoclostridium sp.]